MSTTTDAPAIDTAAAQALAEKHYIWQGDVPATITADRAKFLAANGLFVSLQRLGHSRQAHLEGKVGPAKVANVMIEREYTAQDLADLLLLAQANGRKPALAFAKAVVAAQKKVAA